MGKNFDNDAERRPMLLIIFWCETKSIINTQVMENLREFEKND